MSSLLPLALEILRICGPFLLVCTFGTSFTYLGSWSFNIKTKDYKTYDTGFTSHTFVQYGSDGNLLCWRKPYEIQLYLRVNLPSGKVQYKGEVECIYI